MTDNRNGGTMVQTLHRLPTKSGSMPDIGVKWEVAQITPAAASAMLEKNITNRPMRTSTLVRKYANDMKRGHWRMTFDAIRFDENGELLDGQHRLAASVLADVPFTTLVIYGISSGIRDVIDVGLSRSAGDVLQMHGHNSARNLSSMARW